MRNGKVGLRAASKFLLKDCHGKAGPGPTFQAELSGLPVSSGRFVRVVGWMLLGFFIAGPNLSQLHSQDSRRADAKDETTLDNASDRLISPDKANKPDIILPDIYIAVPERTSRLEPAPQSHSPLDSTTIKQKLQNAERDLQLLQRERHQLLKTMEQFKTRSVKGANQSVGQKMELFGRPSV